MCDVTNRPFIPLAPFLFSRPLEQLELIRFSNLPAKPGLIHRMCISVLCSPLYIIPRKLQSGYRRHLFDSKLTQLIHVRPPSLNQRSRLRVHVVQEFYIGSIQSRQNVFETNIVVVDDHIPQMSLARALLLLRTHRRSRWLLSRARVFMKKCARKKRARECVCACMFSGERAHVRFCVFCFFVY